MTGLLLAAADPNDIQAAKTAGALACPLACTGVILVFVVVIFVSLWKVFTKAGQPGWYSLIPIYNTYILTCEIAKKDVMWFVLEFIPLINIYASFMVMMEVAKKFGKSEAFGLGLFFLGFIFFPILAFGDARYRDGRSRRFIRDDEDNDDDYEEERPRKRSRGNLDFDDEDDAPRRPNRRRQDDDDDDDDRRRPNRRRQDDDYEDDDDEYDNRRRGR